MINIKWPSIAKKTHPMSNNMQPERYFLLIGL